MQKITKKDLQTELTAEYTRRETAENELWLHNRALEYASNGIIITDNRTAENPIIFANRAFLELTGYEAAEVQGKSCIFLQGATTDPNTIAQVISAMRASESIMVRLQYYRKDGSSFWNEVSVSPVPDANGHTTHFIISHTNVTDQMASLAELERQFEERTARLQHINDELITENRRRREVELALLEQQRLLEFSNFELDQFARVASHDLQEPLRMVSSYVRLIERRYGDKLGKDGEDFIRFATEGAERMKILISNLAEYARMDHDVAPFERIELDTVLDAAVADNKILIQDSLAKIEYSNLGEVKGDRSQLIQLFGNLITNAIKYRGKEPPHIKITSVRSGKDITVSVADDGIGIPKRDLERVFLVFRQVDRASRPHGSGIGLAIVKKIAVRHGGRVWVESELGRGSTFKLTLPKYN